MGLLSKNLEQLNAGSNYKFSATKINALGATEYTLATIVVDESSSVLGFGQQLEDAIKTIFTACDKAPRRNNLMLRVTGFNDQLREVHGFKQLRDIKVNDYDAVLNIGGSTALFDAMDEAIQATSVYGQQLMAKDYLANAIVVVITDGENNRGAILDAPTVKKSIDTARKAENLESILVILVGVTNDNVSLNSYLQTVKDDAGCNQYVSIGSATPGKIAKLAEFVSQSISTQSTALGSGQASQPINSFTF
jgi:hypothetical protein